MLALIKTFAGPYLRYAKIAAIVIAIAGAAWTSAEWTRRGCEAAKVEALAAANAAYQESVKRVKEEARAQELLNARIVENNQKLKNQLELEAVKYRREIRNATEKYKDAEGKLASLPPAVFTMEFGRVWNNATDRANGRVPTASADSEGISEPDLRVADIDRRALLENHQDILRQCGKWKADLDSIREWDAQTFGDK